MDTVLKYFIHVMINVTFRLTRRSSTFGHTRAESIRVSKCTPVEFYKEIKEYIFIHIKCYLLTCYGNHAGF